MLSAAQNPIVFAEKVLRSRVHEGQARFLLDTHPVRCLIGGRRSGKSMVMAFDLLWRAVRRRIDGKPFRALISGPSLDQARIVHNYALKLLRDSPAGGLIERDVRSPYPETSLGAEILIMCRSVADHGKHVRGHGTEAIYLDEAGYVGEEIVTEILAPLLADRVGSTLVLASTPTEVGTYLHQLFSRGQDGTDPYAKSFHFPTENNPFVDRDYVRRQKAELPSHIAQTEWDGQFAERQASVFRWSDLLACVEEIPSSQLTVGRYVAGLDPARVRDRSALVVMEQDSIPRRVVYAADLSALDYSSQIEEVARVVERFGGAKVVLDATGGGRVVCDLLRNAGVWVEPVVFTPTRKAELFTALALTIEKHEIRFPPIKEILDELRWLTVKRSPSGIIKYEASGGGHDDFACALGLALLGAGGLPSALAPAGFLVTSSGRVIGDAPTSEDERISEKETEQPHAVREMSAIFDSGIPVVGGKPIVPLNRPPRRGPIRAWLAEEEESESGDSAEAMWYTPTFGRR